MNFCSLTLPICLHEKQGRKLLIHKKIVAAFRGMHVSPAKHSSASVTDGQTADRQTDGRRDRQTTDKVIPMCRYASQATQKRNEFLYGDNCVILYKKLGLQ